MSKLQDALDRSELFDTAIEMTSEGELGDMKLIWDAARRVMDLEQPSSRLSDAIKRLHTRSDDGSWVDHEEDWSDIHDAAAEVLAVLDITTET